MNHVDKEYLSLLEEILEYGERKNDRTGVGTYSIFGPQMRFNLQKGFPILTTKKVWFRGVVEELLWFLRGETNLNNLHEDVQKIWSDWAEDDGSLGPIYGKQFRNWDSVKTFHEEGGPTDGYDELTDCYGSQTQVSGFNEPVDQLAYIIKNIRENPRSRRHVMTTWNAADIPKMNLNPCHGIAVQFNVRNHDYLDCKMYQRSADMFLGVPFNITSYSLLTHIIARLTGYEPGKFIHSFGDAHIYQNHTEQVKEQLSRDAYSKLPRFRLETDFDFDQNVPIDELHFQSVENQYEENSIWHKLSFDDFKLSGYEHHPKISAPIAV